MGGKRFRRSERIDATYEETREEQEQRTEG